MIDSEALKSMISFKLPAFAEIELTLFENCDVACSFCDHNKKSVLGMTAEEINSKIPLVDKFVDALDNSTNRVHLHMVGGELLQDHIFSEREDLLDAYEKVIKAFREKASEAGKEESVFIVTNLLTKQPHRVLDWLKKNSVKLIASYDPTGRPLGRRYFQNVEIFRDVIANFNMVATNTSLKKIISGDPKLDELYENFEIFVDDFLPDKKTQYLIPEDDLYLDFLKTVKRKYPRLMPYGPVIDKVGTSSVESLQFATYNKCTILPDNDVTNYLWGRHQSSDFSTTVNKYDNSNMLYNFLSKNECFSCEHYVYCPLRCPVSWSWKSKKESDYCVNKEFFDSCQSGEG